MTVYVVVMELSFEPGDLFAVFSTREKADAYVARHKDDWFHGALVVHALEVDSE